MSNSNADMEASTQLSEVEVARVGWLELFYDLVVVAWLAHTNMLIMDNEFENHHIDIEAANLVPLVLGAGFVLYVVWLTMTTINNKFPASGLVRRTTMFAQMFLMIVAMLSFDPGGLSTSYGMGAIGLIFLICGVAYADVGIRIPAVRRAMFASAGAAVVACAICMVGIPIVGNAYLSASKGIPFAVAGAVIMCIPLVVFYSRRAQGQYRIQLHHLDERWGQLTLITLGESFLLFAEELAGVEELPNIWLFLLVFVTIVAIWRLYFDSGMRRPYDSEPESRHYYALIVAQFFVIIGIVSTIDALVDAVAGISEDFQQIFGLMTVGSLVFMLSLALLTWGRRGRAEGVVATNLLMALVIGHWTQIYLVWDDSMSEEFFVMGICIFIIVYAWCINLVDNHANRLFQSKLPAHSRLHRVAKESDDSTQIQK